CSTARVTGTGKCLNWIPEANQRVHSVLGETPQDRFEREKPFLLPGTRSYPLARLEQRTVRSRGDVVFANQHYRLDTIPPQGVVYGEMAEGVLCSLVDGEGNPLNFDLSVNVERRRLQEYALFLEGS
ncbi:MAG TPA: hypothetical protein VLH40_05400, partial [Atribacteraceae bacterium]|nr:hypothetical protein [Atribacteraceae bacterium]